jgi:hypothetical protein
MNDIFNTPFEISLRVLLMLETGLNQTADMIAAADFITVYGKDFEISDNDLHGDSAFKYSEFPLRRDLVKKAVKQLVLTGLINVSSSQRGQFCQRHPWNLSVWFQHYNSLFFGVQNRFYTWGIGQAILLANR